MSLIRAKAIQMGYDATASNNFLIYQPLTPDGTFRIAVGNQGSSTDIMTVTSAGSVAFAGTTNFSSLNFGSGSESAPSLFPTGDSNTGIWFPAADTFAVSTGGTERLRVASSGNVGVGTNNPVTKLDVIGSVRSRVTTGEAQVMLATDSRQVYLYNSYAGNSYGLFDGTAAQHRMYYDVATNSWAFHTGASERLRIDSTGNTFMYGQGAANKGTLTLQSADSFLRLKTTGGTTDKQQWDIRAISATGSEALEFRTINDANTVFSTKLWINHAGDVGIGTTTPTSKLEVNGTITSGNLKLSTNGTLSNYGGAELANVAGYGLQVAANITSFHSTTGAERMRIDSNGRVGIGTQTPDSALTVSGTVKAKSFATRHNRKYGFDTLFTSGGEGSRRYHIGRMFDNNQYNWGHFGSVVVRVYDSYYSSGGHREYTLTPYDNIIGRGVSVTQTGGVPSGSSLNYKVSISGATSTGLTYANQPIQYYDIYVDVRFYANCVVEVETRGNNTSNTTFEVTTPTTTGYGSGNYWQSEFYTDTYIAANYTSSTTGSYKWASTVSTLLKQVAWTSFSDLFMIDLRPYANHWKTVEIYVHYVTSGPTRCDHYMGLRDANGNLMTTEWNCWSFKRNASGAGGFANVDNLSSSAAYGRYAMNVDSNVKNSFRFTVDLTTQDDTAAARPGVFWDGNYTWGDIGSSRASGSAHPVAVSIQYLEINLDASAGYSGTPGGTYMYTIVGVN